jgi:hypothetical protein
MKFGIGHGLEEMVDVIMKAKLLGLIRRDCPSGRTAAGVTAPTTFCNRARSQIQRTQQAAYQGTAGSRDIVVWRAAAEAAE